MQRLYVKRTLRDKTSSASPAKSLWDEELKAFGDTYGSKLRPIYANKKSVVPAAAGRAALQLKRPGRPCVHLKWIN
ncbi:Hypothetical predicted protein [Paramuricea clavata]|uniref:Uncharacterized protein n=1 Tax=Paramuricea clavata TaxID=317549 RepID=A0A7D9DPU0_PARCT|nr:Hypothetical predicted protein [Paramuricea clavata]